MNSILFVNAQIFYNQNIYVSDLRGNKLNLTSNNYNKKIVLVVNTISCTGCVDNLIKCLNSLNIDTNFVQLYCIIGINIKDVLFRKEQLLQYKYLIPKLSQVLFFEQEFVDSNCFYDITNSKANPIVLLIDGKNKITEKIDYYELFSGVSLTKSSINKIKNFLENGF